jgi:tetratricopeptide (TPR) repeat protein
MLATSMAVFLVLGSFMVLGLSVKYPALQAYLPFSKQVSFETPTDLTANLITNSKENNLYQQLDSAINEYLTTSNKKDSERAETIAKDIKLRYEDNYGIDLIKYYKSIPDAAIKILAEERKKLSSLTEQPINDNYDKNLVEIEKIAQSFISYGNLVDAHKARILIARIKIKTFKYDEAEITINEGLSFAQKNNYLMLESYFTLWQAKRLVEISNFSQAQDLFNKTIELGKKLEITELFVSSSMTLAGIYLKNDDNEQALKVAQDVLANAKSYNVDFTVSLLQMAGVAAFNNKFNELSKTYLNQAIELSEEHKKPHLLIMSYTFMGLTLSESNQFQQAEDFYLKAKLAADSIEEKETRLGILSITLGYEAKAKLNQGDLQTATKLYQETLTIIKDLKINNDLEISQLEQGLAIALEKSGKEAQAQEHFAIAKTHQSMAEGKKENANFLLSFLPSKYNMNHQ